LGIVGRVWREGREGKGRGRMKKGEDLRKGGSRRGREGRERGGRARLGFVQGPRVPSYATVCPLALRMSPCKRHLLHPVCFKRQTMVGCGKWWKAVCLITHSWQWRIYSVSQKVYPLKLFAISLLMVNLCKPPDL